MFGRVDFCLLLLIPLLLVVIATILTFSTQTMTRSLLKFAHRLALQRRRVGLWPSWRRGQFGMIKIMLTVESETASTQPGTFLSGSLIGAQPE